MIEEFIGVNTEIGNRPDVPELYWIGTQSPETCYHRQPGPVRGLIPFMEEVAAARSRIDILDRFFDDASHGLSVVAHALSQTTARIRILCNKRTAVVDWINANSSTLSRKLAQGSLRVGQLAPDRVHDRFAIIDSDLWHFGSTVGGAYPGLSAASRGWFRHLVAFGYRFDDEWGAYD